MICLVKLIITVKILSNSVCKGCTCLFWLFQSSHYIQNLIEVWLWCISAKSSPNSTFRDSFGILRMSRFWNCHWFLYLTKIWRSYWGFFRRQLKSSLLYLGSNIVLNFLRSSFVPRSFSSKNFLDVPIQGVSGGFQEISGDFQGVSGGFIGVLGCAKEFNGVS